MSFKVSKAIFCVLILCFKFAASIPFSDEPIQQAPLQLNNWQRNQDNPERSWNYNKGFLQTQNGNIAENLPHRNGNRQDYFTHRGIQQHENYGYKNPSLPLKDLRMNERQQSFSSSLNNHELDKHEIPGELHTMRMDNHHIRAENQHYKQQNWPKQNQFQAALSATGTDIIQNKKPLIVDKKDYHVPDRRLGNVPHANFQNMNPDISYSMAQRDPLRIESNSRSGPGPTSYETYKETHATPLNTKEVKYESNRYVENTPLHFEAANLPLSPEYDGTPLKSDNFKNMQQYYINDRNKQIENRQTKQIFNTPVNKFPIASNPTFDTSDNVKYIQHSVVSSGSKRDIVDGPRHAANPAIISRSGNEGIFVNKFNEESILPSIEDKYLSKTPNYSYNNNPLAVIANIADNKQKQASSSEGGSQAFEKRYEEIPTNSEQYNQKYSFENSNIKSHLPTHRHRFMIIHPNNTVEWIDEIEPNIYINSNSAMMEKVDIPTDDNNKDPLYNPSQVQQAPQSDNYYLPPDNKPSNDNSYNPLQSTQTSNEYNYKPASKPFTSKDLEWADDIIPSVSDFNKTTSQKEAPSNTWTLDKSSDQPIWENNSTTLPTLNVPEPEDKKIQQFLDSLFDNDGRSMPLSSSGENSQSRSIDDKHYQHKPIHKSTHTQRSTTVNTEDESIQEFLDSLNNATVSIPPSLPSIDDDDTTTQALFTYQPTTSSSVAAINPMESTTMDDITTISTVEMTTERVIDRFSNIYNDTTTFSNDEKTNEQSLNERFNNYNATKVNNDRNKGVIDSQRNSNRLVSFDDNSAVTTKPMNQSDPNLSDNSTDMNELKLILNIPNDSAGTLKITVNASDSTGYDDASNDETVKIRVDTKEYSDSESTINKLNTTTNSDKDQSPNEGVDKMNNIFIDILNSGMLFSKTTDKNNVSPLSTDNSVVNMWYLFPMQHQCQSMVEKSKVTTIYPNGTIVEEITKTTWKGKDDSAPTMEKTTKIFHEDTNGH